MEKSTAEQPKRGQRCACDFSLAIDSELDDIQPQFKVSATLFPGRNPTAPVPIVCTKRDAVSSSRRASLGWNCINAMMLSRAALRPAAGMRAAALSASPALQSRPALPAIWSRGMAKDNKPQQQRFSRPQNPPSQKPPQSPPSSSDSPPASKAPPRPSAEPAAAEPSAEPAAPREQDQEAAPDLSKLPDLTQGIPSTLEYETAGATNRSALTAVEEGGGAKSSGGGRAKGELPASAYVSSSERRRQKLAMWAFVITGVSAVVGTVYLGRNWTEEELAKNPEVPNGWSLSLWWKRAMARMGDTVTYYQEPAFEKLLPDPDPSFERPYTLCISLEDMLVHSEWSREHGWRVAKRPGVDYFLHYLSQYYEIVLFTTVPFATGEPLVRKLDPYRFIMWPLFREATKYKDGEIVKVQSHSGIG